MGADPHPDTHLCLVSAQPVPNLTPLLDPGLKPRRVILMVSPDMETRAGWLEAVLRPRGIRTEHWPVQDPWDIGHLQTRTLELLEREQEAGRGQDIALNATGGTKPMSIAAYEAFRAYGLPIFYVHPEQDRLVWLHPNERQNRDLAHRLRLEAFLQAHGARVRGKPRRQTPHRAYLEIGAAIVARIDRYQGAIGQLNWLAAGAQQGLRSRPIDHPHPAFSELAALFEDHGLLHRDRGRLLFRDEEARFFVNGGWLEHHVFHAVQRLGQDRPDLHDAAQGLKVERQHKGRTIPNELDVAFLHRNRLHLIECKTRNLADQGADSAGAETLYKLDTLKDLMGGLQARALLVSYRDLSGPHRTRAADLRIAVCAGTQLRNLNDHLHRMLENQKTGDSR